MIEGLRHLPWLQEQTRRDPASVKHLSDCGNCMKNVDQQSRQLIGCGYEPPSEHASPWMHEGFEGDRPSVCVGYSTTLPELIEISRARLHWGKGAITSFCKGEPSDLLMRGIEILESAHNEMIGWQPPKGST